MRFRGQYRQFDESTCLLYGFMLMADKPYENLANCP
jgi:hypothetical protein